MENKFLVLTANMGGKDQLIDPPTKFNNCDYIAFVDTAYGVSTWSQVEAFKFSGIDGYSDRRNAKLYKALGAVLFPEYDYIIWQDASHQLLVDPNEIVQEYGDFDLLMFNHPDRNCIYQEIDVISGWLDTPDNATRQRDYYKSQGMPENYGLFEMACFMKRTNKAVATLDLMWWEQICKFSSRDQCSFMYCLWRAQNSGQPLNIKTFEGYAKMYAGGSKYFNEQHHLK